MSLLHDKVALVTGAASGIGRAAALAFAREGAKVVVADLNPSGGEETVQLIAQAGGQACFVKTNVAQSGEVEALVAAAVRTYGRLDCAFNNAGTGRPPAPLHEKPEDFWDAVIAVNLKGVWLCLKYEIPALLAAGGGAIVNMASVAGLVGFPGGAEYAASKHGVVGLTQTAALELAQRNIRVNAVCPGFTDTPMVASMLQSAPQMTQQVNRASPMHRMGKPEEIAEAVVWLCSDKASFINGQALALDGGLTAG
jgi:NAD(P)-dependent dehydrogenase (short-subunit alcohol dehydrogenase family)